MVIQCCKCRRILQDERWVTPATPYQGPASHTYCSRCFDECLIEDAALMSSRVSVSGAVEASHLLKFASA